MGFTHRTVSINRKQPGDPVRAEDWNKLVDALNMALNWSCAGNVSIKNLPHGMSIIVPSPPAESKPMTRIRLVGDLFCGEMYEGRIYKASTGSGNDSSKNTFGSDAIDDTHAGDTDVILSTTPIAVRNLALPQSEGHSLTTEASFVRHTLFAMDSGATDADTGWRIYDVNVIMLSTDCIPDVRSSSSE